MASELRNELQFTYLAFGLCVLAACDPAKDDWNRCQADAAKGDSAAATEACKAAKAKNPESKSGQAAAQWLRDQDAARERSAAEARRVAAEEQRRVEAERVAAAAAERAATVAKAKARVRMRKMPFESQQNSAYECGPYPKKRVLYTCGEIDEARAFGGETSSLCDIVVDDAGCSKSSVYNFYCCAT